MKDKLQNIDNILNYIINSDKNNNSNSSIPLGILSILDTQAITRTLNRNYLARVKDYLGFGQNYTYYILFLAKLKKIDEDEYKKITNCCSETVVLMCSNWHGFEVYKKCNSKYCPFCSRSKSLKYRAILKRFLLEQDQTLPLRFLTLTWRNTNYLDISLKKRYTKNYQAFKKRLARYGYRIHRGIKTFEVKYNEETGFNCHLHLLFYASFHPRRKYHKYIRYFRQDGYIDVKFIRRIWREITKDSHIINFQHIKKGVRGGVNYLCKYITKSDNIYQLPKQKIIQYDMFAKHLRVIEKFGFKDKIGNYKTIYLCPKCGCKVVYPFQEEYPDEILDLPLVAISKHKLIKGGG